jgi:hypothetical protein
LLASVLALRSLVASSAFSDSLSQYSEILHVSKSPSDQHVLSLAAEQDGNLNSRHSHTETPKTSKMQNLSPSWIDHIIKRCTVGWSEDDARILGMNFEVLTLARRNAGPLLPSLPFPPTRQGLLEKEKKYEKKENAFATPSIELSL